MRGVAKVIWGSAIALIVGVSVLATPASAIVYGQGLYGVCLESADCPQEAPPTVVQTSRGLQVAINLSDGQVIPLGTYTVTVTPLNGQGATFDRAEFYLDGTLIFTAKPDATGTAKWEWDTRAHPATDVKVIVYDTDGSSITKEFHVTIASAASTPSPSASTQAASTSSNPLSQALDFLENTIRAIPTPVVVSIPYLLLAALLIMVLLLLAKRRREAIEAKRMQAALRRAQQLAEEKEGFIELASHYLRTPLTLIKGGADFLSGLQPPINTLVVSRLGMAITEFGVTIEDMLSKAANDQRLQSIAVTPPPAPPSRTWAQPMFWLPTSIVALLVWFVDYLAVRGDKFDASPISIFTQVSTFLALAVGLYVGVRWRQLQRRDHERSRQQTEQQKAIDEARNNLIRQGAANLAERLQNIVAVIPEVPEGQGRQFIAEGCNRINEVLKRFRATATVIPPVTTMPFTSFTMGALLAQAQGQMGAAAEAKHVTIHMAGDDVTMASQQPSWIVQVLATVLDNAVAYSAEGTQVEVAAQVQRGRATVLVSDHGSGIPAERLAELFQPFSKVEDAMRFDHPGLGLSLYLDRLLITNLGGDIHITSQPNQGTTVEISFPIQ